ncbi:hypothetical protein MKX03_012763 [Papaver bracteatum]|nr:hypothetical protein MKX03_012763 [Papaver bracteatum]
MYVSTLSFTCCALKEQLSILLVWVVIMFWRRYSPKEIGFDEKNTTGGENQMRHPVYLIEYGIRNLPNDQEQMAWLIDFTGWSLTIRTAKETLNSIVKYFLDPKTFDKVKFNKDSVELMKTYFDDKNLPTEFGGRANLKYDHEEFSKLMVKDELKSTRERELEKMEHTNNGSLKPEVAQESVIAPASS